MAMVDPIRRRTAFYTNPPIEHGVRVLSKEGNACNTLTAVAIQFDDRLVSVGEIVNDLGRIDGRAVNWVGCRLTL
jgi:hypothetical protein